MHEGHRQRMLEKLKNADTLYDHEVLEILLYNACPRINTNPLAHALLERFGSINEILNADVKELTAIDGIGESTACYLKTVGLCLTRAGKTEGVAVLKNLGDCKKFVSMRLRGRREEFLEIYFLDKSGVLKRIYSYTSAQRSRAAVAAKQISANIALAKPHAIAVAHNHLNGDSQPSENDDRFTRQIQLICDMNDVSLLDHIIYADTSNFYSYLDSGRLEEIKRQCRFDRL